MTKQQFIKVMGNLDDDIIGSYLRACSNGNRPVKPRPRSGSSFLKYAGIAAAVICVAAVMIFAVIKFRVPTEPGSNDTEQSPFIVESLSDGSDEDNAVNIGGSDIKYMIIGNVGYTVAYQSSYCDVSDGRIYDTYEVTDSSDKDLSGKVTLDHETGEVVHFRGITPYHAVDDRDTLTDGELKAAAEELMDDVDFSKYNTFKVQRHYTGNEDMFLNQYILTWQVKRELLCAVGIEINVAEDGSITYFTKYDSCPDDLYRSFISDDERDRLLEQFVRGYIKENYGRNVEKAKFEIFSETLSEFRGKRCINYIIDVDENDFHYLISARIRDKNNPSDEELQAAIEDFPLERITLPDSSTVSKYEATRAAKGTSIGFDFAYIRYAEPVFYSTFDEPDREIWSAEAVKRIKGGVKASVLYKVTAGSTLKNGLKVKSAEYNVSFDGRCLGSKIVLDGELTLDGILCDYDNINLTFYADPAKCKIPVVVGNNLCCFEFRGDQDDNFGLLSDHTTFNLYDRVVYVPDPPGVRYKKATITVNNVAAHCDDEDNMYLTADVSSLRTETPDESTEEDNCLGYPLFDNGSPE